MSRRKYEISDAAVKRASKYLRERVAETHSYLRPDDVSEFLRQDGYSEPGGYTMGRLLKGLIATDDDFDTHLVALVGLGAIDELRDLRESRGRMRGAIAELLDLDLDTP